MYRIRPHGGHWKMLRAMVPRTHNDLFLVGYTHQRIYNNHVTLGSLGVNIRGRSAKLTLSYRTTRQILGSAIGLLSGEHFDDLDGNEETLSPFQPQFEQVRCKVRMAWTRLVTQVLLQRSLRRRRQCPVTNL
ncbi:hypothetical protein GCM10009612_47230 [Streptomyces beijiangensis]